MVDLESGVKNLFQKLSSPELQDSELHFEDGSYLLIFEDIRGSISPVSYTHLTLPTKRIV